MLFVHAIGMGLYMSATVHALAAASEEPNTSMRRRLVTGRRAHRKHGPGPLPGPCSLVWGAQAAPDKSGLCGLRHAVAQQVDPQGGRGRGRDQLERRLGVIVEMFRIRPPDASSGTHEQVDELL